MRPGSEFTGETAMVEAYGARLSVSAPDRATLSAILAELPHGWSVSQASTHAEDTSWHFTVRRDPEGFHVIQGNGQEQACIDLNAAIWLLRKQIRRYVGHHSHSLLFIHAGVVACEGRVILLPGHSFAGKSTLVAALVSEGAEYYSDEFAPLHEDGRVAQYMEPIQLRSPDGPEDLAIDAHKLRDPLPVGLVAITVYAPGATWAPRQVSAAEGVVALMEHTSRARDKPAEALAVLRRALEGAVIFRGERGEAPETARALLTALCAPPS